MWYITVYAENARERIVIELKNQTPCDLLALHQLISDKLNEAAGELSPIIEGGYHIYQKKDANVQVR